MAIKLAGTIPVDHNGLSSIYASLVRNPEKQHVIIAVIDAKSVAADTDTGVQSPTVRIRHVEVVGPESVNNARAMMQRAMEDRTGEITLPFDEPFGNVFDLRTGSGVVTGRQDPE